MPNLARLAQQSVTVRNAYTSVSSCSPSRSVILTGMPQHQNGMYGLHHQENHFMSFDTVKSLPLLLAPYGIHTGMIGKKHVGPTYVYKFDFERDSDTLNMLQCARNITQMKLYVREFFAQQNRTSPFMLYMGFNDAHRCEGGTKYGDFCEKFGNGQEGMGIIEDWKPFYYDPKDVQVPYFLPDTLTTRIDITKQYTSLSRLDCGIGMLLAELERVGHLNDTLIIYTADNGIPFPNAKTNLFEPGMGEPMLISNPFDKDRWGQVSDAMTSTMDIVPTVLDWFGIPMPGEERVEKEATKPVPNNKEFPTPSKTERPGAKLTGHSMLPITENEPVTGWDHVYASHNFHEVTMYYPMRVLRNRRYRLIHNLNNRAPYPLATDLYSCPTFLEILNNTISGKPTNWFKTLDQYYYRDEWELYDLQNDPHELVNLADDSDHQEIRQNMTEQLHSWMMETADTWHCFPHGVRYGPNHGCGPMYNEPHDQRITESDDAGFELGAYNNTVIRTPNFDRLARRGLTLTRGYAATSTCSPSRAAILTGLPQHQMGQYGLYNGPYNFHTFDSVQSLPVILSKAGMYTGIVGKKHVGPSSVYKFDFEKTEENCDEIQVTRNITLMKEYVNGFLRKAQSRPFYLHIGFKDPHRAMSQDVARYGQFSQRFGNGQEGMGTIPDWQPEHYSPSEVVVPPYLPDNLATREDIANQYTSISRLDAGVGMLLNELKESNHLDNTLIIYCGDNGIPFVHAKTNLYEMGIREPMIISSPHHPQTWGTTSSAFVSTLDFLPTILDWCSVPFPQYDIFPNKPARLTGKSLLPLFSGTFEEMDGEAKPEEEEERKKWKRSFSSQSLHEITMFYPMRAMREGNLHLIHNLNYQQFFPIATDLVVSPTFLQLLEDTKTGAKTGWIKTLEKYYYRPEWELYNVEEDPLELHNLASNPRFTDTFDDMKSNLREWQHDTFDPWICYPDGVLFNNEVCIPILNSRKDQSNHSETEKDEL